MGFVTVPKFVPALSTTKVLTTEWVRGAHLDALSPADGAAMTRLAVEVRRWCDGCLCIMCSQRLV